MSTKMNEEGKNPLVAKIIKIAIAILTAILGFFTGAGANAMTTWF